MNIMNTLSWMDSGTRKRCALRNSSSSSSLRVHSNSADKMRREEKNCSDFRTRRKWKPNNDVDDNEWQRNCSWNIQHRIAILYDSNSDTQQTYKIYARDFGLSFRFFFVEGKGKESCRISSIWVFFMDEKNARKKIASRWENYVRTCGIGLNAFDIMVANKCHEIWFPTLHTDIFHIEQTNAYA